MGRWLEHSVTTEIQAPVQRVWTVWADLEAMPRWMQWIESVTTDSIQFIQRGIASRSLHTSHTRWAEA